MTSQKGPRLRSSGRGCPLWHPKTSIVNAHSVYLTDYLLQSDSSCNPSLQTKLWISSYWSTYCRDRQDAVPIFRQCHYTEENYPVRYDTTLYSIFTCAQKLMRWPA